MSVFKLKSDWAPAGDPEVKLSDECSLNLRRGEIV